MRNFPIQAALALCLGLSQTACVSLGKKEPDRSAEEAKLVQMGAKVQKAFELGRSQAAQDPAFVERLEDQVLSETLRSWFSPMAGARRLLSYRDQKPEDPLNAIFLGPKDEKGNHFTVEADPEFQAGAFFNAYDKSLFQPFFRQLLLGYLKEPRRDEASQAALARSLRMAAAFTPRYAGYYPNQLQPEVRQAALKMIQEQGAGPLADRLRFLMLFDERNGAWASARARLDGKLRELRQGTSDELLKMEIKEALDTPFPEPDRAFWLSLALPGLGQVSNGDLQGGILLGGLTAAAWIWFIGKLSVAGNAPTDADRAVAQGDAAWAGGLVALGHLFTAYNASEQVRFFNIVMEWDLLSRPRLKP